MSKLAEASSDHLLRTFAAVPYGNCVLDLGCGDGRHALALFQLCFDLHACDTDADSVEAARKKLSSDYDLRRGDPRGRPTDLAAPEEVQRRVIHANRLSALGYPDEYFDWIVFFNPQRYEKLDEILAEARRVLKSGGWIYMATTETAAEQLGEAMRDSGFSDAGAAEVVEEQGTRTVRAIYRRVDVETPV